MLEARGFLVAVRGAAPCAARGGPTNVGLFVELLPSCLGRVFKPALFFFFFFNYLASTQNIQSKAEIADVLV